MERQKHEKSGYSHVLITFLRPLQLAIVLLLFFSTISAVQLGSSIALTRDSYIYYVDPNYRTTNDTYTNLSLAFRTSELDGLLLWNGQVYFHCFLLSF